MNGGVVVAAAVLTSSGSCLYTDPINMPPTVKIDPLLTTVLRGDPVTFTATTSDPDGDPVTVEWTHTGFDAAHPQGDRCPEQGAYTDPARWPDQNEWPRFAAQSYEMTDPMVTKLPFCVWAFARDVHGAVRPAVPLQVDPGNHTPVARIDIVNSLASTLGFPLYRPVTFSGQGSQDADEGDVLSYTWSLQKRPVGSSADVKPEFCDAPQPWLACLSAPDVSGSYEIHLTVSDGVLSSEATTVIGVASDQLPCVRITEPAYSPTSILNGDPTIDKTFAVVNVDDDGDPSPPSPPSQSMLHYSWFRAIGDGAFEYLPIAFDQNSYLLPRDAFTIGDKVRVRVEIHDRNAAAVDRALANCKDDDLCEGRPGCTQRVTWSIQYQ